MKARVLALGVVMGFGVTTPGFAQTAPAPAAQIAPQPVAQTAPAPAAQIAPQPVAQTAPAPATAPPPAAAAPTPVPSEPPPAQDVDAPKPGERTAKNAVYVELLGAGLFYSLNYDRRIGDVALRGGLMYISVSSGVTADGSSASASWLGVPLSVSYLGIGSQKHSFELGGGVTIHHFGGSVSSLGVDSSGSATAVLGHLILGYRYQPLDGGFFLRAGFTPIIGSGVFLPWPHVGLGGTF